MYLFNFLLFRYRRQTICHEGGMGGMKDSWGVNTGEDESLLPRGHRSRAETSFTLPGGDILTLPGMEPSR